MSVRQIGRNDPCYCGSGRKYKNCCWEMDQLVGGSRHPIDRANGLMQACRDELERVYADTLEPQRLEKRKQFLQYTADHKLPEHDLALFTDWFYFDALDAAGNTLGWNYLQQYINFSPKPLLQCMTTMTMSYLSVYQVIAPRGLYLEVQDLFSGENALILLKKPFEMRESDKLLLLGRLISFKEMVVFTDTILVIKNQEHTSEYIRQQVDFLRQEQPEYKDKEWFKFNSAKLYGIFDYANKGRYLPMNDIRVAHITSSQKETLQHWLKQNPHYKETVNHDHMIWHITDHTYGFAAIAFDENNNLLIFTDFLQDHKITYAELAQQLPDTVFSVISNHLLDVIKPDPEYAELWLKARRMRESERWLNSHYPVLAGKCPRDLRIDTTGRENLHSWLNDLETQAQGEEAKLLLPYLHSRVDSAPQLTL